LENLKLLKSGLAINFFTLLGNRYPLKRDLRRSPPRIDRYDRRQNWSPPRGGRRTNDFDRRDNWDRNRDERKKNFGKDPLRFDGPMLSESQFQESHHERNYKYEDYKTDYKKYNTKVYFNANKNDPRFIEKYHPNSIIERRKRDSQESQALSTQFLSKLEQNDFILPNYDADAHPELFKDLLKDKKEENEEDQREKNETENQGETNQEGNEAKKRWK